MEIINHKCATCGKVSDKSVINGSINCDKCNVSNDVWTSKLSIAYIRHLWKSFSYLETEIVKKGALYQPWVYKVYFWGYTRTPYAVIRNTKREYLSRDYVRTFSSLESDTFKSELSARVAAERFVKQEF